MTPQYSIKKCLTLLFSSTILSLSIVAVSSQQHIVNNKVSRIIDISSQLVKIKTSIHIENVGSQPVTSYIVAIEPSSQDSLSYIDVTLNNQALNVKQIDQFSYEVDLTGHPITASEISKQPIVVSTIFTRLLKPLPKEITQDERQFVKYTGFQCVLSPYVTKTQSTRIKYPKDARLLSFSKGSKMTTGVDKFVYGPFKDIPANSNGDALAIHYENNSPFVVATDLNRNIDVSSWTGKAHVANNVKLLHIGASLKGPFSRIDYQSGHNDNGAASVRTFVSHLPPTAENIYFRDGIGNISTSAVSRSKSEIKVALKPRFPLFGGWVTDFVIGYTLKLDDISKLEFSFSDVLYDNMHVDHAVLRIKLPPGSDNIKVESPFSSYQIDKTNVIIECKNCVAQHLQKPVKIVYNYQKINMLFEPAVLTSLGAVSLTVCYMLFSFTKPTSRQ